VVIPVNGLAVGSVARGSYLKEGSQVHVCNRPICGGGRLLFLLGVPVSGHFRAFRQS
jgi:hypothetical protein